MRFSKRVAHAFGMRYLTSLSVAVAMGACAGCTSYQRTAPEAIETMPEKFVDKKARVYFAGDSTRVVEKGRSQRAHPARASTAPDSVVSLRISSVQYPVLTGGPYPETLLYGTETTAMPLQVNLDASKKVEVHQFDMMKTMLVVGGTALITASLIYAIKNTDFGDFGFGNAVGSGFGGFYRNQPSPDPPPRH